MDVNFKRVLEIAICSVSIIIVWFGIDCLAGNSISIYDVIKFVVCFFISVIIAIKVDKNKH
jgi:uncharacterized protein YebE (UPF0316 family)